MVSLECAHVLLIFSKFLQGIRCRKQPLRVLACLCWVSVPRFKENLFDIIQVRIGYMVSEEAAVLSGVLQGSVIVRFKHGQ